MYIKYLMRATILHRLLTGTFTWTFVMLKLDLTTNLAKVGNKQIKKFKWK